MSAVTGRSTTAPEPVLQVALPVPIRHPFDYLPPRPEWSPLLQPGMRVRVPFGRKTIIGIVVGIAPASAVDVRRLKRVCATSSTRSRCSMRRCSSCSHGPADTSSIPWARVVVGTLPRLLRLGRAPKAERNMRYAATTVGAQAFAEGIRAAPVQARLLGLMLDAGSVPEAALAGEHRDWRRPLRALIAKGWAEAVPDAPRHPDSSRAVDRADSPHPVDHPARSHPADRSAPATPGRPSRSASSGLRRPAASG